MNWISATGRSPVKAMPKAVPTIADSARGVSKTRRAPKRACSPSVARNTPPSLPTSWPMTTTRSSAASACSRARLIAWTMTGSASAIGSLQVAGERRQRQGFGCFDGAVDPGQRIRHGVAFGVDVPESAALEILPQPRQWIAPSPLVDLVHRLVSTWVVGGRVRPEAVRERLDEHGAAAFTRMFERPLADSV